MRLVRVLLGFRSVGLRRLDKALLAKQSLARGDALQKLVQALVPLNLLGDGLEVVRRILEGRMVKRAILL